MQTKSRKEKKTTVKGDGDDTPPFRYVYPDFLLSPKDISALPLELDLSWSNVILYSSLLNYYYYDLKHRKWKRFLLKNPKVKPLPQITTRILEFLKAHDPRTIDYYNKQYKTMEPYTNAILPPKIIQRLKKLNRILLPSKDYLSTEQLEQLQAYNEYEKNKHIYNNSSSDESDSDDGDNSNVSSIGKADGNSFRYGTNNHQYTTTKGRRNRIKNTCSCDIL